MAAEQAPSSQPENLWVIRKEPSTLSTLQEWQIVLKMGQQEKLYPPINVSILLQYHPQQLLVKFENLVHSIFRNENSTMEINVSYFRMMHWQQWQPPAFVPDGLIKTI